MKIYTKNFHPALAGDHANKIQEINLTLYTRITCKEMVEVLRVKKLNRCLFELKMNSLIVLQQNIAKKLMFSHFDIIELKRLKNIDYKSLNYLSKTSAALDIGISSLNSKKAEMFLQHKAALTLSGLKTISAKAALVLSKYQGNILEMPKIEKISPKAFEYLCGFKGEFLDIGSLTQKSKYK
jgi:hypothetical protein